MGGVVGKQLTLDFGTGHDLRIAGLSPVSSSAFSVESV